MELKIYMRNTFGIPIFSPKRKNRLLLIGEEILSQKPDLVFLQEIFFQKEIRILKKILTEYSIVRERKHRFDLGGGLLTFIHKNINYESSYVHYTKSGFLTDLSITDKIANKGFQIIKLFRGQKSLITFIHTHLTCPYEKHESNKMNNLIIGQLQNLSSCAQKENGPLCICGDFNLEPNSALLENFIKRINLKDETFLIEKTYLGNFYYPRFLFKNTTISKKIDYIFSRNINGSFFVRDTNESSFLSDHKALIADIHLR